MQTPSLPDQRQLSPQSVIARDWECIRCGYNLRTLSVGGLCPECGTPVGASLRVVPNPPATGGAVRAVAWAQVISACGIILAGLWVPVVSQAISWLAAAIAAVILLAGVHALRYGCAFQPETSLGRQVRRLWPLVVATVFIVVLMNVGGSVGMRTLPAAYIFRDILRAFGLSFPPRGPIVFWGTWATAIAPWWLWAAFLTVLALLLSILVRTHGLALGRELACRVRRLDLVNSWRTLWWICIATVCLAYVSSFANLVLTVMVNRMGSLPQFTEYLSFIRVTMLLLVVVQLVATVWLAIWLFQLGGTLKDLPTHLRRAGYVVEKAEDTAETAVAHSQESGGDAASTETAVARRQESGGAASTGTAVSASEESGGDAASTKPAVPPHDAATEVSSPGREAVRGPLPCLTCGRDLGGALLMGRCSDCDTHVEGSLLVLTDPDTVRLTIRLIPWAVLFWAFTIVTGPWSIAPAAIAAILAVRLDRRCDWSRLPELEHLIHDLRSSAMSCAILTLVFALLDAPWYFSADAMRFAAGAGSPAGLGRIFHPVGSMVVYGTAIVVAWRYLHLCREMARRARRESLAMSFTVVSYLFLLSMGAAGVLVLQSGCLAVGMGPEGFGGRDTFSTAFGLPLGIWAVCVLAAALWLIVLGYRLSASLRAVPRDWSAYL